MSIALPMAVLAFFMRLVRYGFHGLSYHHIVDVFLYLLHEDDMLLPDLSDLLYHNAGLKDVSGISDDMKELLDSKPPSASDAVELYCALATKQISGIVPSIGGLDGLAFTGGIRENAEIIRDKITARLRWIGVFSVFVIPTDEEPSMAKAYKKIYQITTERKAS